VINFLRKLLTIDRSPGFLGSTGNIQTSGGMISEWVDWFKSRRNLTSQELLDFCVGVAYTCAKLNSSAVAMVNLHVYAVVDDKQLSLKGNWDFQNIPVKQFAFMKKHRLIPRNKGYSQVREVTDHPFMELIEKANPYFDQFLLRELTNMYLEIVGKAYWWIEKDDMDRPSTIWILPPQNVEIVTGENELIDHFVYTTSIGSNKVLTTDEVIFLRTPSLKNPYLDGLGVAKAMHDVLQSVNTDIALNEAMMKNRNRPDLWVSPKEPIGPSEAKRLKARIQQLFSRKNTGGTVVSETALEIKNVGHTPADMESLARLKVNADLVRNSFDVPLALLSENTNLSNLKASMAQHGRYAVLPRTIRFVEALNSQLMPLYDDSGRLFIGFENPVPEDEREKSWIRSNDIQAMVMTPDEARDDMGMPPLPDEAGAQIFVPTNTDQWLSRDKRPEPVAVPGPKPPGATAPPPPASRKPPAKGSLGPPNDQPIRVVDLVVACFTGVITRPRAVELLTERGLSSGEAWEAIEPLSIEKLLIPQDEWVKDPKWFRNYEGKIHSRELPSGRRIAKHLVTLFNRQRKEVLDTHKSWSKGTYDTVDLSSWDQEFRDALVPVVALEYEEELKKTFIRLGISDSAIADSFNVLNPKIKEAIDKQTIEFSASTNATTSRQINEAIVELKQALLESLTTTELAPISLARRINQIFEFATSERSRMIALTEASRAIHAAQRLAAVESGVVKGFMWLCASDACPMCNDIAAQTNKGIGLDGDFGMATDYEAGPKNPRAAYAKITHPPAHPHCRCTMIELLDTNVTLPKE